MGIPFLNPRYDGARFEGKRLPVDLLRDLPLFQELVLKTARWLYLRDNPERQRLPRGWAAGFGLVLADLKDGSAEAVLEWDIGADADPACIEHFKMARDFAVEAVGRAQTDAPGDPGLPPEVLDIFDRLGKGLRKDERILIPSADGIRSATLDRETRRRLAIRGKTGSYEEAIELRGTLPQLDLEKRTYEFLTRGKRIPGQYDTTMTDEVMAAHRVWESEVSFLLSGVGLFARNGILQKIVETHVIDEDSGYDMLPGFEELSKLQPGWYDGEQGDVPPPEGLRWLFDGWLSYREESWFIEPHEIPRPTFSLTCDGHIRVEWLKHPMDVSLQVDTDRRTGYAHAMNLETDEDREIEGLDLNGEEGWTRLGRMLDNAFAGEVQ